MQGNLFLPITINSHYYYSSKNESNNTIVSLRTIINSNVNVGYYDSNDIVISSLRTIEIIYFISLSPQHVPKG